MQRRAEQRRNKRYRVCQRAAHCRTALLQGEGWRGGSGYGRSSRGRGGAEDVGAVGGAE